MPCYNSSSLAHIGFVYQIAFLNSKIFSGKLLHWPAYSTNMWFDTTRSVLPFGHALEPECWPLHVWRWQCFPSFSLLLRCHILFCWLHVLLWSRSMVCICFSLISLKPLKGLSVCWIVSICRSTGGQKGKHCGIFWIGPFCCCGGKATLISYYMISLTCLT